MTNREIDALVAEKVMGWKQYKKRWTNYSGVDQGYTDGWLDSQNREVKGDLPDYSTDIAAAWEVVEKMRSKGAILRLRSYPNGWAITAETSQGGHNYNGPTAPLVICLIALQMTGFEPRSLPPEDTL